MERHDLERHDLVGRRVVRTGQPGTAPIWCLSAVLTAGAIVLALVVLPELSLPTVPVLVPVWLLAVGWFSAEVAVVHYHFRSTAQTFSMSELPLVVGLFFADPQDVVAAVVLGAGAALALVRRQSGLKVVFNLAHLTFGACAAVLVFRALGGDSGTFGPVQWLAALVACATAAGLSTAAILAAIWRSEGTADLTRLPEQFLLTLFTTASAVSLGLLAVGATWQHPGAAALLAVPGGILLLAHRSFVLQRQEHDSIELLHRTALLLDAAPDAATAMGDVVRNARETLRTEVAQLALLSQNDPDLVLVASTSGSGPSSSRYVRLDDVDPVLRRVLGTAGPALVPLDPPLPGPDGELLGQVAVVPLGEGPQARGVLLVADRLGAFRALSPWDLRLLETLASQLAVSLERGRLARALTETARRAERERENALVLQRGILPPPLPRLPRVAIAVRYLPGAAGAEVGGDWYDVIPLPGGDVGVAIGDVSGHDLEAAARMGQARSALRAYASDGHGPSAVLARLNRLLARTDPDFLGTCAYLVFSPARETVTLVSAGHPPPLLLAPGERPRLLQVEGDLPLGVLEETEYAETTVPLPPGSALALYTDGLVETRTLPLEVGLSRLTALRAAGPDDDLEELAERVVATAPAGTIGDDLTLLVLRHEPAQARADGTGADTWGTSAGRPEGAPAVL